MFVSIYIYVYIHKSIYIDIHIYICLYPVLFFETPKPFRSVDDYLFWGSPFLVYGGHMGCSQNSGPLLAIDFAAAPDIYG